LGHIDEDCITEMAVAFKKSRRRTIQLVSEVEKQDILQEDNCSITNDK